jgi:4a-hydroxytetrahydrobiopterin dehydratase|tara:strand:- start:4777 stop:5118 length:342 start_codon:yes stop_codon:yes gene_type:complete
VNNLANERCEVCTAESEPVASVEQLRLLETLPDWRVASRGEVPVLIASFDFTDYEQTLAFVNRIGALAEEADHHPRIVVEWGSVEVSWWTHAINGLHKNDFIMAARTSEILRP